MLELEVATDVINKAQEVNRLRQKIGTNRYSVGRVPELNMPRSSSEVFRECAERLGIPSLELEYIATALFSDDDESTVEELKKLIMISKLRYSEPSLKYAEAVSRAQATYEQQLKAHQDAVARDAELKAKLDQLLTEQPATDIRTVWINTVQELETMLEGVNYEIGKLSHEERTFVRYLNERSKHVQITPVEGRGEVLAASWSDIRKFHHEHIAGVLRGWIKIKEEMNGVQ